MNRYWWDDRLGRAATGVGVFARAVIVVLGAFAGTLACQQGGESPATRGTLPSAGPPTFVGGAKCAGCHQKEADAFGGSNHARAMQVANGQTVLGDFGNARLTHRGITSTFFRRGETFFVRTDGPDGKPGEFEIAYTFGISPLQQYLLSFPDGRLQALGIAWDTRPKARGGQRWFHLYPAERLAPPDPLHWTGREQTWNFQCAECHSTDLHKNYDLANNRYATTWAEVTVSCEACHGPGSVHVAWAEARPAGTRPAPVQSAGLVVRLGRGQGAWTVRNPRRGIAEWSGPTRSSAEVETCARCHARRRAIVDPYPYGQSLLDTHVPALLEAGLYHADGQILGEVYEYGSFVQSRMFRAGVTCSDCHEPHSQRLRATGNAVCAPCHVPARFDSADHTHHKARSEAAQCVSCHMPARTYMVVQPRRDHSFPVPRPDLSVVIGTPNACGGCHRDRPATWAAARMVAWYGPAEPARRSHFAVALDAGRRGLPVAEKALAALATDVSQPGIARATALSLLPEYLSPASLPAVETALGDGDPLVRAVALATLEAVPPDRRAPLGAAKLRDPIRAVRLAAARVLAATPRQTLATDQQADLDRALRELIASETVNADRPEAHVSLATLYAQLGRPADAESALRTALRLAPDFVPALVTLADLLWGQGRSADSEWFSREAIRVAPDSAQTLYAVGLLRVQQGRGPEAVALLRRAAALRPESPRFAYVYAVALQSTGDAAGAIAVLEQAHRRGPANRDVLAALATFERERGDLRAALRAAEQLAAVMPGDRKVQAFVESLRRQAGSP